MIRILMCGARDWEDVWSIAEVLSACVTRWGADKLLVIEGGAPGADTIAGAYAQVLGIHVAEVAALWSYYGRSAGPRRNAAMAVLTPELWFAFHSDIIHSKGTASMVKMLRRNKVPGLIVPDRVKALKVARRLVRP